MKGSREVLEKVSWRKGALNQEEGTVGSQGISALTSERHNPQGRLGAGELCNAATAGGQSALGSSLDCTPRTHQDR